MKKTFSVVVFIIGIYTGVCAQQQGRVVFAAGIRAGLPIGDFKEFTSFGIGAEFQGEYSFSKLVSGVGATGYTHFLGKDYGGGKTKATGYIPILVGARLYPVARFFLGAQIGYGILAGGGSSEGAFNYQPQVGYNANKFQLILNYNSLSEKGSTLNHLAVAGIIKF